MYDLKNCQINEKRFIEFLSIMLIYRKKLSYFVPVFSSGISRGFQKLTKIFDQCHFYIFFPAVMLFPVTFY